MSSALLALAVALWGGSPQAGQPEPPVFLPPIAPEPAAVDEPEELFDCQVEDFKRDKKSLSINILGKRYHHYQDDRPRIETERKIALVEDGIANLEGHRNWRLFRGRHDLILRGGEANDGRGYNIRIYPTNGGGPEFRDLRAISIFKVKFSWFEVIANGFCVRTARSQRPLSREEILFLEEGQ